MRAPRPSAAGRARTLRRPFATQVGVPITLLAVTALGVGGCAQGSTAKDTSFTSLGAANAQAQAWVEQAVTAAAPDLQDKKVTALPSESCDSASGRNAGRYEISGTVPKDQVDTAAAGAWRALAADGFTLSKPSQPPSGTDPVAPGTGSPSWTISGTHDGFQTEVVGNRADPGLRVWVITPCFGT